MYNIPQPAVVDACRLSFPGDRFFLECTAPESVAFRGKRRKGSVSHGNGDDDVNVILLSCPSAWTRRLRFCAASKQTRFFKSDHPVRPFAQNRLTDVIVINSHVLPDSCIIYTQTHTYTLCVLAAATALVVVSLSLVSSHLIIIIIITSHPRAVSVLPDPLI